MNDNSSPVIVSIVVPVFNSGSTIAATIKSVQAQQYEQWELIIVDDGSEDNTEDVVRPFAVADLRVRWIQRDREPKGAPTCRNIGALQARGEYIMFLDADDTLLPHCLLGRLAYAARFPENHAWVFPMAVRKTLWAPVAIQQIPVCSDYLRELLSYRLHWGIMCPLWRRSAIESIGGFREGYPRLNDPELMIRAYLSYGDAICVAADHEADSVYTPSVPDYSVFYRKVAISLEMFIPDISTALVAAGRRRDLRLLIGYYRAWWRDTYSRAKINRAQVGLVVIWLFRRHGVISGGRALWDSVVLVAASLFGAVSRRLLLSLAR